MGLLELLLLLLMLLAAKWDEAMNAERSSAYLGHAGNLEKVIISSNGMDANSSDQYIKLKFLKQCPHNLSSC